MIENDALATTLADHLNELGGIPAHRVRTIPPLGKAELSDLIQANESGDGNTKSEMARKRLEYFHSGIQMMWIVDCVHRSVAIYTSMTDVTVVGKDDTISGGEVLPGFTTAVRDFFTDLDIGLEAE